MKILVFTSQFCWGAAERLAADLAVDLNELGIHADVMSMYGECFEFSAHAKGELLRRGIPQVHFLNLDPNPSATQVMKGVVRLRRILRCGGYDVLETSSLTPGIIASWGCRGTSTRHVMGLHQVFDSRERRSAKYRLFVRSLRLQSRTACYAISDFVREKWNATCGDGRIAATTVYNCISLSAGDDDDARTRLREELGLSSSTRIALCVGRLTSYKRQDLVVEALASVCDREDLVVVFAGTVDRAVPGTDEMMGRLGELISRHSLEGRIHFLGQRVDVRALMSASDVLIHATEKEGFGLVLVEALAVGLPIVSTDVEGIPEVLRDTDSVMVGPGDAVALREATMQVLSRTCDEASRAAQKGRQRAACFRQRDRTRNMIRLFEDAISKSRSRLRKPA